MIDSSPTIIASGLRLIHIIYIADGGGIWADGQAGLPNSVVLADPGTANTIPGTVHKTSYAGSHLEYFLETELGEVFAVSASLDNVRKAGESIGLTFAQSGPVLVRS